MKKLVLAASLAALAFAQSARAEWHPKGNRIMTVWADSIDPQAPLAEYPRPIMERSQWKNLNGLWQYALTPRSASTFTKADGEILVPFAIESALSGVARRVGADSLLWYERSFSVPRGWNERVLLHFGAVDWQADVWVNDVKVGSHSGGFTPFSFDITDALDRNAREQKLTVRVWDPTDRGPQPRGKQVSDPKGIWYTPVTGIWQTVWIEPVSADHITSLSITPDIDRGTLSVGALTSGPAAGSKLTVEVIDAAGRSVATGAALADNAIEVLMPEGFRLWSPDDPALYDLRVRLYRNGKQVDEVKSYAAMRKFSTARDQDGIVRLQLNNKPLFMLGPLDQGWWPDGLYTAPTDAALLYDLQQTKDLGYNMVRKHIKVEPARWYTYADKLGLIVWQDMPSGDKNPAWLHHQYFDGVELTRTAESEATYRKELKEMIDALRSYPSIGVWVPFNEAWGQFKTPEIAAWVKQYDPTRLVNPASGGNHYACGDMLDLHHYPQPDLFLYDASRATVLGEYGGIGLIEKEHLWEPNRNWGYITLTDSSAATDKYVDYAEQLLRLAERGFSAGVYTQTTDVEVEVNGLMTYDRKKVKLDADRVREVNKRLTKALEK